MTTSLNNDVKNICLKNTHLLSQDANRYSYYQDVANFCLPRKAWITTLKFNDMQMNQTYLFDSRPLLALKESACGFHSKLTSSVNKWFDFRSIDPKKMQSGKNQKYFKDCSNIQYDIINNSNWNETILEAYTDDLCFGVAPIWTEEDYKDHVRYTSIPVEQASFERDERGEVCGTYRRFKYTASQIQSLWPNNLPKAVKEALDDDKYFELFDIIHFVGTRDKRDVSKRDSVNMKYRSVWVFPKEEHKLSESGYVTDPIAVMEFWRQAGDTMAYSPCMDLLAATKLSNAQKRTILRRAMKDADAASMSPARFWLGRFSQNPNAMNYYDKTKYSAEDFQPIKTGGDFRLSVEMMGLEQDLIDRGLFLHLFKAMTMVTKDMNNPEANQRILESLELIGPVVGRMCRKIGATQIRTFDILNRRGVFPDPPPDLVDGKGEMDIGVEFLSPLARAQRAAALGGLSTWLSIVNACKGIRPDAGDNVDTDMVISGSADYLNVDPTFVREKNKVDAIRKKTAAAQQQIAKLQMAEQAAGAVKDTAQAHKAHKEAQAVK